MSPPLGIIVLFLLAWALVRDLERRNGPPNWPVYLSRLAYIVGLAIVWVWAENPYGIYTRVFAWIVGGNILLLFIGTFFWDAGSSRHSRMMLVMAGVTASLWGTATVLGAMGVIG